MTGLEVSLEKRTDTFHLCLQWEIGNELVVILGESGAGKSMTLKMVAGLMRPDEGMVRINGRKVYDSTDGTLIPARLRRIGYVFQNLALFPHMTVYENILYGASSAHRLKGDVLRGDVMDMLCQFHIEALAGKYPREISGGQQQRTALARALIGRPELLLLDEPFSSLDNTLKTQMRELIKSIKTDFDVPVILVTHDLIDAYSMADRVIVYHSGTAAAIGQFNELMANPLSDAVKRLVDITPYMTILDKLRTDRIQTHSSTG
ncbi:MAG: ATP-binding cassette domain-containing protein [Nitrospirae bacterium]|nr:ATP-binding cassette domain-containing protein [Nitrospirota bacterium]